MQALQGLLEQLYTEAAAVRLLHNLQPIIAEAKLQAQLLAPFTNPIGSYQQQQLYVTYPEAFRTHGNSGDFDSLAAQLPRLQQLGFNAIHVLPFLESPLIDKGFDVSEHYQVRKELGGNAAFERFNNEARRLGMRVFMDLILNHISEEHAWYQGAIKGSERLQSFFIRSKEKPQLRERRSSSEGEWALYERGPGQKPVVVHIVFPEQVGALPHWRQGTDGAWYYHSFYPQQLDMNWANPEVFLEFARILAHWAARGLSMRLDAIPFLNKTGSYFDETAPTLRVHTIVTALNLIVKAVHAESVFLVEACQEPEEMLRYFGENKRRESELAYNFPLCSGLWAALALRKAAPVWQALQVTAQLPQQTQWVTFLRNHDELSVPLPEVGMGKQVVAQLLPFGLPFRSGTGVSGRTFSLLGRDPRRHSMAYALLASLPGAPALIYGDELGKPNDLDYMHMQTSLKHKSTLHSIVQDDTRDINRGEISAEEIERGASISSVLQRIFRARAALKGIATAAPVPSKSVAEDVVAGSATLTDGIFCFFVNLGPERRECVLPPALTGRNVGNLTVALDLNQAQYTQGKVTLPAYAVLWLFAQS